MTNNDLTSKTILTFAEREALADAVDLAYEVWSDVEPEKSLDRRRDLALAWFKVQREMEFAKFLDGEP